MIIEINRLTIRSLLESDIPEFAAIVSDPEVTKFLGDGSTHSYKRVAEYVYDCIRSEAEEGFSRYAVILRETHGLIGFCGFKRVCNYIDFGWRYAKQVWNNGYATEAATAVLDYGVNTLRLSGIVAESATENIGSVRVIEKLGMKFKAFGELHGRKTVCYRQPGGT